MSTYDIGDRPVATITFADIAGGSGVSSAVTCKVRNPAGLVVASVSSPHADLTNPSPNVWVYQLPVLTMAGVWTVRARSTSGLEAAVEQRFTVAGSDFADP